MDRWLQARSPISFCWMLDPLRDIRNITKIAEIFLSGKEFGRAALDQMLQSAEAAAKQSPANPSK
ncbi:MAG TPA: hypothetical protein VGI46_19095 [Candidatus Acidoferrum sp.]|jgi:hypothetical protein